MSTTPTALPSAPPQATTDDWFPADPQAPAGEPQAPTAAPAPPAEFLRAETGTVYKTAEEAARGVAEKDRFIATQKQQIDQYQRMLAAAAGIPQGQSPQQPSFIAALEASVKNNDGSFERLLGQYVASQMDQRLQGLQPMVEFSSTERAIAQAGQQFDPNIPNFVRSEAYQQVLAHPAGKNLALAIRTAATNPHLRMADGRTFGEALPEFLYNTYLVGRALTPAPAPVAAAPPQRPAPTTIIPPQMVQALYPQGYVPPAPQASGGKEPTFDELWNQLPDRPLSDYNTQRR